MIPAEAVAAAVKAFRETHFMDDALMNALEAAAPHMRQAFMLEMNLQAVQDELNTPLQFRKASRGDD